MLLLLATDEESADVLAVSELRLPIDETVKEIALDNTKIVATNKLAGCATKDEAKELEIAEVVEDIVLEEGLGKLITEEAVDREAFDGVKLLTKDELKDKATAREVADKLVIIGVKENINNVKLLVDKVEVAKEDPGALENIDKINLGDVLVPEDKLLNKKLSSVDEDTIRELLKVKEALVDKVDNSACVKETVKL
jgi:hypothetical protein